MKRERVFNGITSYFKEKLKIVIKFCVFIIIFFMVYSLYHVPLEPVLYASLLVGALALIFSIYDFILYYNKHVFLKEVLNGVEVKLDNLPQSKGLIEKDYQNIVEALFKDKSTILYNTDNKYGEMVEYYTMWAHQIKTPISAFSMIVQSMEQSNEKKLMEQELFKIEQYVEMVLHYVRLDNLSSDLKLQKYSLQNILRNAVKKYASSFIYNKISLDFNDLNYTVLTDEKWIAFVIEQIISNALKYTKKGTISIYMDEHLKETLVIEDTGMGISEEDIPRVFEKGFTGYNGRMDKKSTGIGLYLCKEIINKLSHKIYITSELGKGTKVFIDFSTENINIE